jgi:putative polysaccharide transport protein
MTSRIQKSIKNAKVNVIFYVITAVLAFFSRKVFLDNLGTEFLGLSSTLGDILNLMNITELGIGTAVGVTLYKPLFNDEREKISDIISVYGFLYSRIGILIGSVSFLFFSQWYMVLCLVILLIISRLFFLHRRTTM